MQDPWSSPAGVRHHNQSVPLGAVADGQLDLAQRELAGRRAAANTPHDKMSRLLRRAKEDNEIAFEKNKKRRPEGPTALLLQLPKPLVELHGGEGQRDVRGQAGRGLLVGQVLLGAGHAGAQVGDTAARAGRVRLAVPALEGEGGGGHRRRGRRGRRRRGRRLRGTHRGRTPLGGSRGGLQGHAGLPDRDGGGLV